MESGTRLLRRIIGQTAAGALALRLGVAKISPARHLHGRLGFRFVREDEREVYKEHATASHPKP